MSQDPLTPGVSQMTYTKSEPLKLTNLTVLLKLNKIRILGCCT